VSVLVVACLCAGATARADGGAVARADRLFKDGRRAAERRDYAQACRLFEDSFRLDPGVGTLINLGDCAEHLGDLERAYGYYRTAYARMADNDDRAPRVRDRVSHIEQHSAKVTVHLEPDAPEGTVVTIDNRVEPSRGAPIHLAGGTHVVLVTAVGYRGKRYEVRLAEGDSRSLHVSPGAVLEAELPTGAAGPAPRAQAPSRGAPWARPVAITAMGFGVAGVWVGSLAGVMAIDRRDVQAGQCDASNVCTQAGVDAAHEGAAWATVSTAAFVAGGVLLAAGAALLVVSLAAHAGKPNVTVGLGPGGALLRGSFE
jgi:hypothetical protein